MSPVTKKEESTQPLLTQCSAVCTGSVRVTTVHTEKSNHARRQRLMQVVLEWVNGIKGKGDKQKNTKVNFMSKETEPRRRLCGHRGPHQNTYSAMVENHLNAYLRKKKAAQYTPSMTQNGVNSNNSREVAVFFSFFLLNENRRQAKAAYTSTLENLNKNNI